MSVDHNPEGQPCSLEPNQDDLSAYFGAIFRYATDGAYLTHRVYLEKSGPALSTKGLQVKDGNLDAQVVEAVAKARMAANHQKPAVYCLPLAGFSCATSARAEDLDEVYTLTVDLDQRPAESLRLLQQVLGPPTVVVESGAEWINHETGAVEKKLHVHWRLMEPATGAEVEHLQKARRLAAVKVGGDVSAASPVHAFRAPGSFHRKATPRLAKIAALRPDMEIDLGDALDRLREMLPAPWVAESPAASNHGAGLTGNVVRTATPQFEMNLVGELKDGRERKATEIVWAVVVGRYRQNPAKPTQEESDVLMKFAFENYLRAVDSRIPDLTVPKEVRLEHEGRGITMFKKKWTRAMDKWDGGVARAAAERPPARSLVAATSASGNEVRRQRLTPGPSRSGDAGHASADLQATLWPFFELAESVAVARQRHFAHKKGAKDVLPPRVLYETPRGPARLARVELGIGKTHETVRLVLDFINGRFGGDGAYDAPLLTRLVDYRVQNHRQAKELAARFNEIQPGSACVWLGREQPSPSGVGRMCLRHEDMSLWLDAGGSADVMCKACPFSQEDNLCPYKQQIVDAPVVISAAPGGVTAAQVPKLPRTLKLKGMENRATYGADLVILDETRPQGWLGGVDERFVLHANDFSGDVKPPPPLGYPKVSRNEGLIWASDMDKVNRLLSCVFASLGDADHRMLTFGEIRSAFPLSSDWMRLYYSIQKRRTKPKEACASLNGPALRKALRDVRAWNARVRRMAMFAFVCAQALEARTPEGSEHLDTQPNFLIEAYKDDDGSAGVLLRWREPVAPSVEGKPLLILDGTADEEILKQWLPDLEVAADIWPEVPQAVTVTQVCDSICGYTSWNPEAQSGRGRTRHKNNDTALRNVERLAHLIDFLVAEAGRRGVGVILPKGTEGALEAHWRNRRAGRPQNVLLGHFNGIAGLDLMKDVRFLVVWSRPSPPPATVEMMASTIFNRPVQHVEGAWYPRGGNYLMRDGSAAEALKGEFHPDPFVERVRRQIVDAELYQAIGRARHARRGPDAPLVIVIGTAQPTALPVDRLVTKQEVLAAGPIEALAARGVVVPCIPSNRGFVGLIAQATGLSHRAVKHLVRGLTVQNAYKSFPIGVLYCESTVAAEELTEFRVKLAPARYATTVFLRGGLADDPRAALERQGLDVAWVERVTPNTSAATPAAPAINAAGVGATEAAGPYASAVAHTPEDLFALAMIARHSKLATASLLDGSASVLHAANDAFVPVILLPEAARQGWSGDVLLRLGSRYYLFLQYPLEQAA